jgi:YD repeat-containing protein
VDADGYETRFHRDLAGRVTQIDFPNHPTHYRTYDSWGRLTYSSDPGRGAVHDSTIRANGWGRLARIVDTSGSTTYFYDNRGRMNEKETTIVGVPATGAPSTKHTKRTPRP